MTYASSGLFGAPIIDYLLRRFHFLEPRTKIGEFLKPNLQSIAVIEQHYLHTILESQKSNRGLNDLQIPDSTESIFSDSQLVKQCNLSVHPISYYLYEVLLRLVFDAIGPYVMMLVTDWPKFNDSQHISLL